MSRHNSQFWHQRVANFARIMFPFFPNCFAILLQTSVTFWVISRFFSTGMWGSQLWIEWATVSVSMVLFLFLFRCFDETKDYESDKVNFPDRPLVTGVMSLRDMKILQLVVCGLLLLLNLPQISHPSFYAFLVVFVFTLLASRWFFVEKQIRSSLPLALLTHNPVVYLYQLYVASFFVIPTDVKVGLLLFLVGDGLPGTAWEIARKIRGRSQEDTYTTYSKIWGPRLPAILVVLLMLVACLMTGLALWPSLPKAALLLWIPALGSILFAGLKTFQFWKKSDVAPPYRVYVELIQGLLNAAFLISLFVKE